MSYSTAAHVRTLQKYLHSREPAWLPTATVAVSAVALAVLLASETLHAAVPRALFIGELHGFTGWAILHVASLCFLLNAVGRAIVVGRPLRVLAASSGDVDTAQWADAALTVALCPGWAGVVLVGAALVDVVWSGNVHLLSVFLYLMVLFLAGALAAALSLTACLVTSLGEGLALGIAWTPVVYMLLHCGVDVADPLLSFSPASMAAVHVDTVLRHGELLQTFLLVGTLWYYLWRAILARLMEADRPAAGGARPALREGLPVAVSQLGLLALLASFSAASIVSDEDRLVYFHLLQVGLVLIAFCISFLTVSVRHAALRRQGVGEILAILPVSGDEWVQLQAGTTVLPALGYGLLYCGLGYLAGWLLQVPAGLSQAWLIVPASVSGLLLGFAVHPPATLHRRESSRTWSGVARTVRMVLPLVAVVLGGRLAWSEAVGQAPCPWAFNEHCVLLTTQGWPSMTSIRYPEVAGRVAVDCDGNVVRLGYRELRIHDGRTGQVLWSHAVAPDFESVQCGRPGEVQVFSYDGCETFRYSEPWRPVRFCCRHHAVPARYRTASVPTLFPTPANCFVTMPDGTVCRLPYPQHGVVRNDEGVVVVWQGDALQWYLIR